MNDYGKTSDQHEGQKVEGAHEAANQADNEQASHWTAGKDKIPTETEIARKAVSENNSAASVGELVKNAENRQ